MSGVTELDTDGMDGTIESTPFCDNNGLEEVYLPDIDKLIYPMFYNYTMYPTGIQPMAGLR